MVRDLGLGVTMAGEAQTAEISGGRTGNRNVVWLKDKYGWVVVESSQRFHAWLVISSELKKCCVMKNCTELATRNLSARVINSPVSAACD